MHLVRARVCTLSKGRLLQVLRKKGLRRLSKAQASIPKERTKVEKRRDLLRMRAEILYSQCIPRVRQKIRNSWYIFCNPERSLISLFSIADSRESKLRLDVEEKDIKHSKVLLDTELLMQKVIDKQDQIRNLEETLQFEIDLLNQETEKLHKERETFFRNGQKKGEENR